MSLGESVAKMQNDSSVDLGLPDHIRAVIDREYLAENSGSSFRELFLNEQKVNHEELTATEDLPDNREEQDEIELESTEREQFDLSTVRLGSTERALVLTGLQAIHRFAHFADPLSGIKQFSPERVPEFSAEPAWETSERLVELLPFVEPMLEIVKRKDPKLTFEVAHNLWHIPQGFVAVCARLDYDPDVLISEVEDYLKMPGGRLLLEEFVSPESQFDVAREYALQVALFLFVQDFGGGVYTRPAPPPSELLAIAKEMQYRMGPKRYGTLSRLM